MNAQTALRIPRIPAAARKAGATSVQRTCCPSGAVFAVGFKTADMGGDPEAVRASFAKKWIVDWDGNNWHSMILRPLG